VVYNRNILSNVRAQQQIEKVMSALFKLGQRVNRLLFRSPDARSRLRKLGMVFLRWPPYVARQRKQLVKAQPGLSEQDRQMLASVSCCISIADTMYEGDAATYLLVGLSGLRAAEAAMKGRPALNVKTVQPF
jgi:hypothetical protein